MTRRVTVIVEGREYLVEVEDLNERPIKATVNQKTYFVDISGENGTPVKVRKAADSASAESTGQVGKAKKPVSMSIEVGEPITAPMPGDINEIRVAAGDVVEAGDVICVLEAMKMKNLIYAPQAGVVASVDVVVGQSVDYGEVLVRFEQAA